MAKKHHMTKHQYNAYKKKRRSRKRTVDMEDEDLRGSKAFGKVYDQSAGKIKNHLRHLHGSAADFLADEDEDAEINELEAV